MVTLSTAFGLFMHQHYSVCAAKNNSLILTVNLVRMFMRRLSDKVISNGNEKKEKVRI